MLRHGPGRVTTKFVENCLLEGSISVNTPFFCLILRPLNCAFSKMLKSVKNTSKTTDFPKFRENKATVVNHDSKYRRRGQERKQKKKTGNYSD